MLERKPDDKMWHEERIRMEDAYDFFIQRVFSKDSPCVYAYNSSDVVEQRRKLIKHAYDSVANGGLYHHYEYQPKELTEEQQKEYQAKLQPEIEKRKAYMADLLDKHLEPEFKEKMQKVARTTRTTTETQPSSKLQEGKVNARVGGVEAG